MKLLRLHCDGDEVVVNFDNVTFFISETCKERQKGTDPVVWKEVTKTMLRFNSGQSEYGNTTLYVDESISSIMLELR